MKDVRNMSQLQRQLLSGGGGVNLFTQQEFDDALAIGKAEIMKVAIETTKMAIKIEREACADIIKKMIEDEDEGEVSTALQNAEKAIRNRIPTQND